jgi:nucleotide-binding universal stress UspA family protein
MLHPCVEALYDELHSGGVGQGEGVILVRRYLVVANQTLGGAELSEEIRKRLEGGPSYFYVLVPNTRAVDYYSLAAAAGSVPMPALITECAPAMDEEAAAQAQHRLEQLLGRLQELGAKAEGELGHANPLKAISNVLASRQFDEVILSTLPQPISRWLRMDLPRQVQRGCGLPVAVITARG